MTYRGRPRQHRRRSRANRPRAGLRRGVIILPSAFTMGNLFFGIYSIVAALRGDLMWSAWCIVIAATLDSLDGRVARFTRTGSDFGAELDSLTDAVSFGVAPALIMIVLYFQGSDWSWVVGFAYISAVVVRLARFNIEQGGEARSHFHGLPSPAAGVTLATHYPFTRTPLFQEHLAALPWTQIMVIMTVLLSILMLSHIPYDKISRVDLRTPKDTAKAVLLAACIGLAVTLPSYWIFPLVVGYALWGLLRPVFLGLVGRLPERDPLLDAPDPLDSAVEPREMDYHELTHGPDIGLSDDHPPGPRKPGARKPTVHEPDIIAWKEKRS